MADFLIYAYSLLTVVVFVIGLKLSKKLKSTIFNPFILSLLMISAILIVAKIPFERYYQGNAVFNQLLGVSVVALAVPFYEQLPQLLKHWKKILIITLLSTLLTMTSGVLLALLFGASKEIIVAILPKSVTTPIAISIVQELDGNSALGAVAVVVAGITGSAVGIAILRWINVNNSRAIGLSMGAVSHILGTASAMGHSLKAGSYASVSLVLSGLFSSFFAPIVFGWVVKLFFS